MEKTWFCIGVSKLFVKKRDVCDRKITKIKKFQISDDLIEEDKFLPKLYKETLHTLVETIVGHNNI